MKLAFPNTGLVETLAVAAVNVAAFALLGGVAAYWTWQWIAPEPEPGLSPQPDVPSHGNAGKALFGEAAVESAPQIATGLPIRLLGVVAATEGRAAYAVVIVDDKEIRAVQRGAEVSAGVVLAEVAPDHVVLDRGGSREVLAWPEKARQAEGGASRGNR